MLQSNLQLQSIDSRKPLYLPACVLLSPQSLYRVVALEELSGLYSVGTDGFFNLASIPAFDEIYLPAQVLIARRTEMGPASADLSALQLLPTRRDAHIFDHSSAKSHTLVERPSRGVAGRIIHNRHRTGNKGLKQHDCVGQGSVRPCKGGVVP